MMILHGPVLGMVQDHSVAGRRDLYQQNHHMLLAQARAMALCHETLPQAKIGPAPNIVSIYPASSAPEDVLAADDFSAIRNWLYLDVAVHGRYNPVAWAYLTKQGIQPVFAEGDQNTLACARPDFIAFNYYATYTVAAPSGGSEDVNTTGDAHLTIGEAGVYRGVPNPHLKSNDFGWEIDPTGFRVTLREIYDRYRLPLLVTENGLGAYDTLEDDGTVHDGYRVDYLAEHIRQMQLAAGDGVDVLGYCPWSAIDLISTHQGASKRYGFVYVDRDEFDMKDLARVRKDSFFWYQDVIGRNGLPVS